MISEKTDHGYYMVYYTMLYYIIWYIIVYYRDCSRDVAAARRDSVGSLEHRGVTPTASVTTVARQQ